MSLDLKDLRNTTYQLQKLQCSITRKYLASVTRLASIYVTGLQRYKKYDLPALKIIQYYSWKYLASVTLFASIYALGLYLACLFEYIDDIWKYIGRLTVSSEMNVHDLR